jgi:hypothetical protein
MSKQSFVFQNVVRDIVVQCEEKVDFHALNLSVHTAIGQAIILFVVHFAEAKQTMIHTCNINRGDYCSGVDS